MRMFNFNTPQEKLEAQLFKREVDLSKVIAGRFVRNSVLSGMCYGDNDLVPSFLKTRDVIHPLVGTQNIDGETQSCYGALLDSANTSTTKAAIRAVVQPWNTTTLWAPGGQGLNSWLAVKLPEATLVEKYLVASTSSTCPLSWKLQASNDGTNWTDLDVITNTEMWTLNSREEKEFEIPAETKGAYLWYRLLVTATNATTMSISSFRLFRPETACAKGQLLLDASAENPLVMSFMDGFATDGVTPVDIQASICKQAIITINNSDSDGIVFDSTKPCLLNLFLIRNNAGGITVSLETGAAREVEILSGGMQSELDRGFKATLYPGYGYSASTHYLSWGRSSGSYFYSKLTRDDASPFFVSYVQCGSGTNQWDRLKIGEVDGTETDMGVSTSAIKINRNVLYLVKYASPYNNPSYSIRVFSGKSNYSYKISGGHIYAKKLGENTYVATHKIKIGSACIYNGDIYNIDLATTLAQQWKKLGENLSYLD